MVIIIAGIKHTQPCGYCCSFFIPFSSLTTRSACHECWLMIPVNKVASHYSSSMEHPPQKRLKSVDERSFELMSLGKASFATTSRKRGCHTHSLGQLSSERENEFATPQHHMASLSVQCHLCINPVVRISLGSCFRCSFETSMTFG